MKRFISRVIHAPRLQIHCWGGFGSQLFALSLQKRITMVQSRKTILVFHTSGVTFREVNSDIQKVLPKFKVNDDFRKAHKYKLSQKFIMGEIAKLQNSLKSNIKRVFRVLGFIAEINYESDFEAIKPWCLQIRGHYSYLDIPNEVLEHLWFLVLSLDSRDHPERLLGAVHWRLGDLLSLEEKQPVEFSRISKAMSLVGESLSWTLFSDSRAEDIVEWFPEVIGTVNLVDKPIIETICDLVNATYFIGTNSKISYWVVRFRHFVPSATQAYMPIESKKDFNNSLKNVAYY